MATPVANPAVTTGTGESTVHSGDSPPVSTSVIAPLSAQQANFLNTYKSPFNAQQLETAQLFAKELGIPFSVSGGETMEDDDWIGGADGLLQLFYR